MSLDSQSSTFSNEADLQAIAAKLDILESNLTSSIRSAHTRNTVMLVVALGSALGIGCWLAYAHHRFTSEINPTLVADLGQKYLEDYLPSATSQLEASLKQNAPSIIAQGENRLRAVPASLEEQFRSSARREIDARIPDLKERLYQSLKVGLTDAQGTITKSPGDDDAARFRNLADSMGALYRTQTLKLTDDLYSQYAHGSGDIVNGLALLAEDKNLTREQKTQRNLVRDFLILARDAAPPEPRSLPDAK